jgi:hypothetical protein
MPPPAMPPTLHNIDDVGKSQLRALARGMLWLQIRLLLAGYRFEFTQPLTKQCVRGFGFHQRHGRN